MKVHVTKANTFIIEPDKHYVCLIRIEKDVWTEAQRAELEQALKGVNIDVVWLPDGAKYKLTEVQDGKTDTAKETSN